jgi:hypothetical protein
MYLAFAGRIKGQASPTAANVKKPLAGLQPQFAADMFKFLFLGFVERVIRGAKVGAGVRQRTAEPRLEKPDRLVIVVRNRGTVAAAGVHRAEPEPLPNSEEAARQFFRDSLAQAQGTMKQVFHDRED